MKCYSSSSSIKKINIVGAGAFGVFLAYLLSKKYKENAQNVLIVLHEKGNSILPGWRSTNFESLAVNTGFHGLEMPRAEKAVNLLFEILGKNYFKQINDEKLCFLETKITPFRESISNWPSDSAFYFEELLNNNHEEISSEMLSFKRFIEIFKSTRIANLFERCSIRYAESLEKSWSQFYPWFFPLEFLSDQSDEGWRFRDSHTSIQLESQRPYYLLPRSGLLSEMIPSLHKKLESYGIKVELNSSFADNLAKDEASEDLNIWASSSVNFLSMYQGKPSTDLLSSKKYMHLILLKCNKADLTNWLKSKNFPSEIIVASEDVIGLSRLSFPSESSDIPLEHGYVLTEYLSVESNLDKSLLHAVENYLSSQFNFRFTFIDVKMARTLFNLSTDVLEQLKYSLEEIIPNTKWHVPFPYWWPINIAKCGMNAIDACDSIYNLTIRKNSDD